MSKIIDFHNRNQQNKEDFIDVPIPKNMEEVGKILDKIDLKELNGMDCLNEYAQLIEYAVRECQKNQREPSKYKDYNSALANYLIRYNEFINFLDAHDSWTRCSALDMAVGDIDQYIEPCIGNEEFKEYHNRLLEIGNKVIDGNEDLIEEIYKDYREIHNKINFFDIENNKDRIGEYFYLVELYLTQIGFVLGKKVTKGEII